MTRHEKLWTPEEYDEWERCPNCTAVRAILDPESDVLRLAGVLFMCFKRRHLTLEHILVHPDYRRQRVASLMFSRLINDIRAREFATISARVLDNCDPGITWLVSQGFKAISVLPGGDVERDRYLFTWPIKESTQKSDYAENFTAPVVHDAGSTSDLPADSSFGSKGSPRRRKLPRDPFVD